MNWSSTLTAILLFVIFGAAIYQQIERRELLAEGKQPPEYMICETATVCARWIEMRVAANSDEQPDVTAKADGSSIIYEYALDYEREDFSGVFEDGSTLAEFETEMRSTACEELYHRDFIEMDGTVIHWYRYADGETQLRIVIDKCSD